MVKDLLYQASGGTCVAHAATHLNACLCGVINVGASDAAVRMLEAMRGA